MKLESLLDQLNLDPVIMLLVLCAGLIQKYHCATFLPNLNGALRTMLLSLVLTVVLILIRELTGTLQKEMLETYFITFCVTTTFYEFFFKKYFDSFLEWIRKKDIDSLSKAESEE